MQIEAVKAIYKSITIWVMKMNIHRNPIFIQQFWRFHHHVCKFNIIKNTSVPFFHSQTSPSSSSFSLPFRYDKQNFNSNWLCKYFMSHSCFPVFFPILLPHIFYASHSALFRNVEKRRERERETFTSMRMNASWLGGCVRQAKKKQARTRNEKSFFFWGKEKWKKTEK